MGVMLATIVVSLITVAAALTVKPGRAVGVIVLSMLLWPEYLRVPMGIVQMSAPRAGALALVCRLLVTGGPGGFRWTVVDTLVCAGWAWDLTANLVMGAGEAQLISMVGRALDTVVVYFAARLALRGPGDVRLLAGPLALAAIAMGAAGALEAATGRSLYEGLYAYGGNPWFDKDAEYRFGFLRAKGSTSHAIYFGVAMALLVGLLWSLRAVAKSRTLVWLGCGAALVGALSSLSSGPQIALAVLFICASFTLAPWAIRPALGGLVVLCAMVETLSHRHFYQLIDYLALSSETAWYRARLIEVAVSRLPEYWLAGVGDRWPHHWGALIDTRLHVDVVNHYIIVALYGGLPSLACYVAVQAITLAGCARAASRAADTGTRRLAFGLCCTLIALMVASMSIGLFGPPLLLSSLVIGAMSSLTAAFAVPVQMGRPMHAPAMFDVRALASRGGGLGVRGAGFGGPA